MVGNNLDPDTLVKGRIVFDLLLYLSPCKLIA